MPLNNPQTAINQAKPTLSLKAQAALEELTSAKLKQASDAQQEPEKQAERPEDPDFVSIGELASQGHDALLDAFRKHREKPAPVYTPPPLTARQLSARELEFEAGRKSNVRHAEQQASRPVPPRDPAEITTPIYRPGTLVPDPVLLAGQSAAGTREFGK